MQRNSNPAALSSKDPKDCPYSVTLVEMTEFKRRGIAPPKGLEHIFEDHAEAPFIIVMETPDAYDTITVLGNDDSALRTFQVAVAAFKPLADAKKQKNFAIKDIVRPELQARIDALFG